MRRKLLYKAWTDRDHFLSPLKMYIFECVLTNVRTLVTRPKLDKTAVGFILHNQN